MYFKENYKKYSIFYAYIKGMLFCSSKQKYTSVQNASKFQNAHHTILPILRFWHERLFLDRRIIKSLIRIEILITMNITISNHALLQLIQIWNKTRRPWKSLLRLANNMSKEISPKIHAFKIYVKEEKQQFVYLRRRYYMKQVLKPHLVVLSLTSHQKYSSNYKL